jgi:hypothetical protein
VLTGEVIGLPRLPPAVQLELPDLLAEALDACEIPSAHLTADLLGIQFFQTGRFQTVLDDPAAGLPVALHMIAWLANRSGQQHPSISIRVAVALGKVQFLDGKVNLFDKASRRTFRGGGKAFSQSNRLMEKMRRGDRRIGLHTPWRETNAEFQVVCRFLDHHIKRWSTDQASSILALLRGEIQQDTARALGISQSAVAQRFQRAGGPAIKAMLKRYAKIIEKNSRD